MDVIFRVLPQLIDAQNSRNISHWSLEEGYEKEITENQYPFRVFESGRKGGLELVLASQTNDFDTFCSTDGKGFKISISVPGDSLEGLEYFQIDSSEDTIITMKPKVIDTSKGLRNYEPLQRKCFFSSERELRFFKSYTVGNCLLDCLEYIVKYKCRCTIFSMPSMYIKLTNHKELHNIFHLHF